MAVYIKSMETPKEGYVDVRLFSDGRATTQTGEHPFYREMKITEVKEPHGNLIDKDEFLKCFHIEGTVTGKENAIMMQNMLNETLQAVADSPNVIERSEDD